MKIAIVGGGIVGLAHAYWAQKSGHQVILFERNSKAHGASVRNFGLIWPIGQKEGKNRRLALDSRNTWIELSEKAGFWLNQNGSLHLAYQPLEWEVLNQFVQNTPSASYDLLETSKLISRSPYLNTQNLIGGLVSETECTVNPREALQKLADYLNSLPKVSIFYEEVVLDINATHITTSRRKEPMDLAIVCSGIDYQTLFQDFFEKEPLTKCKLQMMKGVGTPELPLGPTLCGGLTLLHYQSFHRCPSLSLLNENISKEWTGYQELGIHVMLAQHDQFELIIGDSHQYGSEISPFDNQKIDDMILDYLNSFARLPGLEIIERWHGVYSKTTDGTNYIRVKPANNVTVVTGLGGAGMTLSFGIAKETIKQMV